MKAYLFWYKFDIDSTTEYVQIIAYTYKQACFFWWRYVKNVLGHVYDYDLSPCNVIDERDFMHVHNVGDILGQYAIL